VAEKRLAGVTIVALAKLEATRTVPRAARSRTGALILAILFGLTTVGLLAHILWSR
jgi:hypothetical protein